MSDYIDTVKLSTTQTGSYTAHIVSDTNCVWLFEEPYVVLIEPHGNKDYMYVLPQTKYELGPSTVEEEIGECELCESKENLNPCFQTSSNFRPQAENIENYFPCTEQSILCLDCLKEFEKFITETIPKRYKTEIFSSNL